MDSTLIMQQFTLIFLAALVLTTGMKLWLGQRHIRYILAHRDAVPAVFAAEVNLHDHRKAADYSTANTRLGFVNVLLDAAVLLAFTLGGGLQLLDGFWSGFFPSEIARGMALIFSAVVLAGITEMPLNYYHTFVIEQRFGFNKMTLGMFITDSLKQFFLAALLGLPLLFAVLWLMQKMGGNWWLYVWLTWMGFNLLVLAIYPTFIAPLFNKFAPLEEGDLKTRIEALLGKCGFRARGLFVMDGSRRSSHGNAYFTGFGAAKRIVFFDTLLKALNPAEIEAVLAHELGHFKRHHIYKRLAWMFGASLAFLWVLGWLMNNAWFYAGLGVTRQSIGMALILFFWVAPVFTFVLHPLTSLYSRKHEFEADQYAAQHTNGKELVRALVKLYKDNATTLTPDPLHSAFYDSHPPAGVRIARLQKMVHNT
jgi:STE24 endopeptidase